VDGLREVDQFLVTGHNVEVRQNGALIDLKLIWMADGRLGIVECGLRTEYDPLGLSAPWQMDANGRPKLARSEGPVEIRLSDNASPEAREILRQKRAGEIP